MSTTVLVTGATGFVGRRALAPLVATGWDVHAVARRPPQDPSRGVTWHAADLLEPGSAAAVARAARATHLLHLAWTATPGVFWTDPANLLWTAATLQLAHAFAEEGGRTVVAAGSCAEYDWDAGVCDEQTTSLRPATPYGAAKLAALTALEPWSRTVGVDLTWARLFHLYGPGEPAGKLVSAAVEALSAGRPVELSAGDQQRDYLHVDDAARGLVHLLTAEPLGAVNLATGQPVSVRDLVSVLGAASGRPDLLRFGARPTAPGEPPLLVADVRRVQATGWRPAVGLAEGLAGLLHASP
jgi:nucleoside-diphosphate-sugar epimerase